MYVYYFSEASNQMISLIVDWSDLSLQLIPNAGSWVGDPASNNNFIKNENVEKDKVVGDSVKCTNQHKKCFTYSLILGRMSLLVLCVASTTSRRTLLNFSLKRKVVMAFRRQEKPSSEKRIKESINTKYI